MEIGICKNCLWGQDVAEMSEDMVGAPDSMESKSVGHSYIGGMAITIAYSFAKQCTKLLLHEVMFIQA